MKVTVSQKDLSGALATASRAIGKGYRLPILSNVLIATDGDGIRLYATDLGIGITCRIPATVHEEGSTTVPAKALTAFVKTERGGSITLELVPDKENVLRVSGKRASTTIRGMDAGEYPTIPTAEEGAAYVALDAATLREMIGRVVIAASKDDARPVFTAMLARVRDGRLALAAADSFRLAVDGATLADSAANLPDMLIPAQAMKELARILPKTGPLSMIRIAPREPDPKAGRYTEDAGRVIFRAPEFEMVSNLVPGVFPNYEVIIPKRQTTTVLIETAALRDAVKRIVPIARDSANIMRIGVACGCESGECITLSAENEDTGSVSETLDAAVDGPGLNIIFNVAYFADFLTAAKSDLIELDLNGPQQPGVLRLADDSAYRYVMMPMHNTR